MSRPDPVGAMVARFRARLSDLGLRDGRARLVVGFSGGCDSLVLLHLLRFHCGGAPPHITVAHLDHAMRPDSAADLQWVAGLCRAWNLPLRHERLDSAPTSEADARRARYAFLRMVRNETGSDFILTAHQADDQAETVLFRILRGTGIRGLRGIPERTPDGILRPLLPFWRRELEEYAKAAGLRWRIDETNRELHATRNQIRLRVLPQAESSFAPAARESLVRLAEQASEADEALERLAASAEKAAVRRVGTGYLVARSAWAEYDSATTSRVLRRLLRRLGVVPSGAGTRLALQFITHASSGRQLPLPGGVHMYVEFDEVRIEPAVEVGDDLPLTVPLPEEGGEWHGSARVGGIEYEVTVRRSPIANPSTAAGGWVAELPLQEVRFPLRLRGWRPGDRVRTAAGTKTLKKLFLELRVVRSRRHQLPVVTDAAGTILWIGGLDRRFVTAPAKGGETLHLTITNARLASDPGPHRRA